MSDFVGRIDQYEWSLIIDGVGNTGVWDDASGGATQAKETKYRPGGMGPETSLGGQTSITNVTLTRGFHRQRDNELRVQIRNQIGKARCVVVKQPLDADGNPFGKADVYGGRLNAFTPADTKADSNDVDTYAVEISTDGTIG